MLDVELLEKYITENLEGVVSEDYAQIKTSITFTDGEIHEKAPLTSDNSNIAVWVLIMSLSAAYIAVLGLLRRKKLNKTAGIYCPICAHSTKSSLLW